MNLLTSTASEEAATALPRRLRVLLVPDSIHWITGTIARSIIAHNSWIQGTIVSGAVLDIVARAQLSFFESFDLVHFLCPYASKQWLPLLSERLPCVTSHHHVSDEWSLQRHNLDGDAIIVGSSQWADDVKQRGALAEKVVRVPYGVDASRFVPPSAATRAEQRKALGLTPRAIVLGFFAKWSSNERDRKGTDIFISAVQKLNRTLSNLEVLIIGPGWDELVTTLSNDGVRCVWLPFVKDGSRMPLMYQALDFYWVTARVEGGPVTLLEAMSSGLCCITTAVGLARDIVVSGINGVVVPFDDVDAFVEQTRTYAASPDSREVMGKCARATILETMDIPVTTQGVREAYRVAASRFRTRTGMAAQLTASNDELPPELLERIAILEELTWAEFLILHGQRLLALRIIAETWGKHPRSSLPPRFLLRNVLPRRLVQAIVRARKRRVVRPT